VRLWTLHPMYLDSQGLVAVWREGLLAQAVLRGETRGYKHHPQLQRFREHPRPLAAITLYLACILEEAQARGYRFDATKIGRWTQCDRIQETRGQLSHEWEHLKKKLQVRSPEKLAQIATESSPRSHPLFILVRGGVREWERVNQPAKAAIKATLRARTGPPLTKKRRLSSR
jgi:hypothetical protein